MSPRSAGRAVGVSTEDQVRLGAQDRRAVRARSFRLLREMLGPHRWGVLATVVLVVVAEILGALGPAITGWGIDLGIPAVVQGRPGPLLGIAGGYLLAAVASAAALYLNISVTAKISQAILYRLRQRTFAHAQRLSLEFHEKYTSGRVISRLTSDLESMREFFDSGLSAVAGSLSSMLVMFVLVFFLDWRTGLVVLAAMVPMAGMTVWFSRASEIRYRAQTRASARLVTRFVETMSGIRAVMAFRAQPRFRRQYCAQAEDYREQNLRSIQVFGLYMPGTVLLSNLTVAAVLLVGGFHVIGHSLAVGTLLALVLYTQRIFDPIMQLSSFYNTLQSATASLEKLSGLLEERPGLAEPTRPRSPGGTAGHRGHVEFDEVLFSYVQDLEHPTLHRLSLDVPAGQNVALVGPTGAGKSTVAKLLARFYDVSSGAVRLDGVDVRDLADADLRDQVVMVTQEAFLFSGSVAENIELGRPGASRQDIEEAARRVGADAFIRALPEGYDTDLRTRGGRVSAGQRQLLSFARAFLADPAVLVLDEATASLDLPSEKLVQQGLATLLAGRTSLVIAHRLSTVLDADRVLVVEEGRLVEDGAPAELIAAGGRFARLHEVWEESQG